MSVLRSHTSVEVQSTANPGELDSVLHRAGSRRIVVAGGDGSLHAVVAALYRRNDLKNACPGSCPSGRATTSPGPTGIPLEVEEAAQVLEGGTPAGGPVVDELGNVVVNNVHPGAGAHASRGGARWKERLDSIGFGRLNLGRLGYPVGALQRPCSPSSSGSGSRWTARSSSTSTTPC